MSKIILISLIALTSLSAFYLFQQEQGQMGEQSKNSQIFESFQLWKQKFGRQYSDNEESYKLKVYTDNFNFVESYNKEHGGEHVVLNHFADLTNAEYQASYLNKTKQQKSKATQAQRGQKMIKYDMEDVPVSVDWREKGAVTPVQKQGKCEGASYAFSVVGALEGAYQIETGKLVELSTQQLIDCDRNNYGCDGGDEIVAYVYTHKLGIMSAESYPYKSGTWGDTYTCKYDSNEVVFQNTNAYKIQFGNPQAIEYYVAQQPVSAGIDGSTDYFRFYSGKKVFKDWGCGNETNESVLIVGYNNENEDDLEKPYWILKGSAGKYWGDEGYMKLFKDMKEGKDGMCGINEDTHFPEYKPSKSA